MANAPADDAAALMNAALAEEIRTSDCWDGPVQECVQLTVLRDRGEAGPLAAPGLLLVTRTMFYIMEQVSGDDAAIIHEDLIDAVDSCEPVLPDDDLAATGDNWTVEDDQTPLAVTLGTVDGIEIVVESVRVHGAMSFTLESVTALFPAAVKRHFATKSRPATPPPPPEPILEMTVSSPVPVLPTNLSSPSHSAASPAAVPDESFRSDGPTRLESTARQGAAGDASPALDASAVRLEAERIHEELQQERARLQSMLDSTVHAHGAEAVEMEETVARGKVTEDQLTGALALHSAFAVAWRGAQLAATTKELADVKQLHCSTHTIEAVLPDGVSGLNEVPLSGDVQALLEKTEKAVRASLGTYLTTEQLQSRDRRKKLEVEMATRDVRVELASQTRTIAQLRADLTTLRARCADLESSIRAKTQEATELRNREQAVIDRARRREEELYAQLERLTTTGGPRRTSAAPAFDFIQRPS